MKLITSLICAVSLLTSVAFAQNHRIEGQVTDRAGQPLQGVTIRLEDGTHQDISDREGRFALEQLASGPHRIRLSFLGYQTRFVPFALPRNTNEPLSIRLAQEEAILQTVEIVGRAEQSYKNATSFAGSRTETLIKEDPQAISYVTKEVMEDQQAFKPGDILKNISGVNSFSYYNNDISIRGFRSGGALINGLRNPTSSWSQSLLANVERVEVIKGPASILYGDSDPGGTVNTVTKKPLVENRKSIDFATGSFNTLRLKSDFTGPMNEQKTLLYRLNLAYQNAESFRVLQGGEDLLIAPSISFLPSDRTRVNFDFVYSKSKSKLDRGQPLFGATAGTDLNSTPISFAIAKQNDFLDELNLNATLSIQHRLTDQISLNASYMKFLYDEDLLEHRTSRYAVDEAGAEIPTLMGMQTIRRKRKIYNDNLSVYLASHLKTGAIEHRLTFGYDYDQNVAPVGGSNYNAVGYRNADNTGFINDYDPTRPEDYLIVEGAPVPNVPHFDLANPDYSISEISGYFNVSSPQPVAKIFQHGIYLQDQLKWGRFRATLSVRQGFYTSVENYQKAEEKLVQQSKFIPRVGLLYMPIPELSVYANYAQGYQPQSASIIADPDRYGGPFDPLTSVSYEIGAKSELLSNLLAINLAVYHIEKNNILMNANDGDNPDLLRQLGQQRSRGVEIDVNGQILPNFSV
ncbi:MAG: TonB-dependent siderophore receptor, partial [Sphingobacterium sp.]